MSRRTPESLADYLVVAICPALIMLLLGSFLFFLVHVFYQGQFETRLLFVLAMFVMAIVCITRIAMEEGKAYATLFAFPIGLLVGIALARFVQIRGPLEMYSGPINWTLMAIVWAAAHRLTWDCTLIDDTQDASGAGLLAQMGLDAEGTASGVAPATTEATTGTPAARRESLPWWQTFLENDRSPHPPGVWVVIFSLVALPIFGIGGRFIPEGDLEARRRCFLLLVVYCASALALLLATSFLGLRRYLRQRRLEMPLEMAGAWVGAGIVLILATLLIASLLPRPSPEYSLAHLVQIDSLERKASQYAFGPEGGKSDPNNPSPSGVEQQEGQKADQSGGGKADPNNKSGEATKSGKGPGGSEKGKSSGGGQKGGEKGASKGSESGKSGAKSDSSQNTDDQSSEKGSQSGEQGKQGTEDKRQSSGDNSQSKSKGNQPPDAESQDQNASPSASNGEQSRDGQSKQADSSTSSNGSSGPNPWQRALQQGLSWFGSLGGILKSIFYLALAIVAAVLAGRYRAEILAAWRKLLAELRDLWAKWFGKPEAQRDEQPAAPVQRPRRFADFADPFAGGQASRMSPAELVRYTFQALEAWGRDNGCTRTEGQTALEYAAAIGQLDQELAREAQHLAELYSRLAYAPPAAIRTTFEPLRSLWRKL
jgi:hypothetical protein